MDPKINKNAYGKVKDDWVDDTSQQEQIYKEFPKNNRSSDLLDNVDTRCDRVWDHSED